MLDIYKIISNSKVEGPGNSFVFGRRGAINIVKDVSLPKPGNLVAGKSIRLNKCLT